MNNKTKKLNVTWILPSLFILFFIIGFVVYDKLTFIPELTFCSSNQTESILKIIQNFCEVPLLKRIVLILNTRLIVIFIFFLAIFYGVYHLLNFLKRSGYVEGDIDDE